MGIEKELIQSPWTWRSGRGIYICSGRTSQRAWGRWAKELWGSRGWHDVVFQRLTKKHCENPSWMSGLEDRIEILYCPKLAYIFLGKSWSFESKRPRSLEKLTCTFCLQSLKFEGNEQRSKLWYSLSSLSSYTVRVVLTWTWTKKVPGVDVKLGWCEII